MEGQISYLEVKNAAGLVIASEEFVADELIQPVFDAQVDAGVYAIRSWQRPCNANCGNRPDPTANECEANFALAAGTELFVTAAFAPRAGCSIESTPGPLPSPIPDAVVFRPEYASCGNDLITPRPGAYTPVSRVRLCFIAANRSGSAVEMTGYEQSATPGNANERVIYSTRADRSVEVFRRLPLPQLRSRWQHYVCSGLSPVDESGSFTLTGCSEPETL